MVDTTGDTGHHITVDIMDTTTDTIMGTTMDTTITDIITATTDTTTVNYGKLFLSEWIYVNNCAL
jgi:hypothetical protein